MNSATHIIAISDFTKATIVDRYGIEPAKVTTVHIGLDSRFQQVTDLHALGSTRAKYNLPSAFAYYPANSWPHKNHATLLQTIRLLKDQGQLDFKLVLTGVVYPEHQGLFALLEELGLRDDVMHLGFLPHADIPAIYALASCLVFPSLFEGFGMPVLEAMSCGCPVICSNSTSLPELCGDAGMLVDPMREEEIAQALATLMVDNTVRLRLGRTRVVRADNCSRASQWPGRHSRCIKALGRPRRKVQTARTRRKPTTSSFCFFAVVSSWLSFLPLPATNQADFRDFREQFDIAPCSCYSFTVPSRSGGTGRRATFRA